MSNLKILLKNNLYMLLGKLQGKKKRKSTATAVSLLVLGMIGIFAVYSLQAWSMFRGLPGKLCVFHAIITTLTTLLIIGIMRVSGKTKGNDSDFLLSLPIKKRDIIISKLTNQYLFDLFFSFILLLPFIVIYEITAPVFSASVLIFGLITILFLPLLSVGISQIMEFVVVKLFNKIKYGNVLKSLVPTLIYILLLILMLIKTSGYGKVQFESMEAYFQDRWISNQILTFIFEHSFVSVLVFGLLTVVPAVVGVILKTIIYGKNFGIYENKKTTLELKKQQKPFRHLFKKEIRNYFSTTAYLVNTIIGPILIVALPIAVAIMGADKLLAILQLGFDANNISYILALVVNLMVAMTCISAVSVSLEGRTLWFIQTLPISTEQFFLSKLAVSLVIVVPPILVSSIIFGIVLNSFMSGLTIFAISLLFLMINDVSGLMINLWFPKLNWENETQVVKQSLSVLLAMIFNAVVALIPVAICLIFNANIVLSVVVSLLLYTVILFVFLYLLSTKGKELLNKLKE